tara:strand:+ start:35 stop:280 length:246 start_codon:yes stop_codon:yes gene_type:complete
MLSLLEELQSVEHKESTLPKNLSAKELEELLIAIDGYFIFNYSNQMLFSPLKLKEMEAFLEIRHEVLSKYQALSPHKYLLS